MVVKTNRVSFRMEKKKLHQLKAITNHNQRLVIDNKVVKPENTHLNRTLYEKHEGLDTDQAVKLDIKNRVKGKNRKDATVAIEVMLSASPEYFRDPGQGKGEYNEQKMEAWVEKNIEALKEFYGKNLIRVELHLDESTPHLHAIVVPIHEKELSKRRTKEQIKAGEPPQTYIAERLDAKEMYTEGGEYDPNVCQDFFADAVKDLDIKRGIKGSRATHSKLKELDRLLQEASDEAPRLKTKLKDPNRKSSPGGFFKKASTEDDASYFKRAHKRLQVWASNQISKSNKLIRELYEALAVISKQLEEEKKRTETYSKIVDDPDNLVDLGIKLKRRAEIIKSREDNLDMREERMNHQVAEMKEQVRQYESGEIMTDLRKNNQRLSLENESLKEALKPK